MRKTQRNMIGNKLQQIPVSRKDHRIHSGLFASAGQCPDYIIRFKSGKRDDLDPHRFQHFLKKRNLFSQFLRHHMSCSFVICIHLMPECRCMHIESHRKIRWLFFFQHPQQDIQKSVYCSGMDPFRVCQIREAVKGSVDYAVSVDQQDFIRHSMFLSYLKNTQKAAPTARIPSTRPTSMIIAVLNLQRMICWLVFSRSSSRTAFRSMDSSSSSAFSRMIA